MPLEKEWLQHREDLQGTGHAILHRARLAGPDTREGTERPVQQETHGQEKQAAQIPPQGSSGVAAQGAKGVWIRVRLQCRHAGTIMLATALEHGALFAQWKVRQQKTSRHTPKHPKRNISVWIDR